MKNTYTNTNLNPAFKPFNKQDYVNTDIYSTEIIKSPKYNITQYEAINKSKVIKTVSIYEVLDLIRKGNEYLPLIEEARKFGKVTKEYDYIKANQLPTFRFNFQFRDTAKNINITNPTGLIYLDIDNVETVPHSDYIYAKWKSLSNLGFGILVKIDNLTITNFADAYNQLSEVIGIATDTCARKATQQTVLSYDNWLYCNNDSKVYHYNEIKQETKKVSLGNILKKEKEGIVVNETIFKKSNYSNIRYDNISDYFTGENAEIPFLVFKDEKTKICKPFIPNFIKDGARNSTMFSVLSNYASLNPHLSEEYLLKLSNHINSKMETELSQYETKKIIDNVLKMRTDGELEMYSNQERRILINPNLEFTKQEKQQIVRQEVGKVRKDAKSLKIYETLESWNFDKYGKITQLKVSQTSNIPLITLKRYWEQFKNYVKDLNSSV